MHTYLAGFHKLDLRLGRLEVVILLDIRDTPPNALHLQLGGIFAGFTLSFYNYYFAIRCIVKT